MILKLPVLQQDKMLRVWMQNMIVHQIAKKLLKARTVMIRLIDLKQNNVKQYLENVTQWLPMLTAPEHEIPCTCSYLKIIMKVVEEFVFCCHFCI